ncbi:MAG: hypothetical protein AB7E32_08085 [Desulfovibrio sp.]
MAEDSWVSAPVWEDWRVLTRTIYCSRIAFEAEISKWTAPSLTYSGKIVIQFTDNNTKFETHLDEHIETIADGSFFYSMILLRAVSLLESHSKLVRYIVTNNKWDLFERTISESEREEVNKIRLSGGIANWGTNLLFAVGQSWDKVRTSQSGLQEVLLVRNTIAHGYNYFTPSRYNEIKSIAPDFPFNVNDPIRITHDLLQDYRSRIKAFLRITCDGVYHTNKTNRTPSHS